MIISELLGSVRISQEGPLQDLEGKVYLAENDDSYELGGVVNFDPYYYQSVNPTGVVPQIVSLALEIEGYGLIKPAQLTDGISWERDIEGGAKITLTVDRKNPPFGNEIQWKGPPPGMRQITLWGAYVSGGIPRWSKIISGAVADHSSSRINSKQAVMTISVLGPEYRYETKKVDYTLDTGHGKTPQKVIKEILDLLGINNVTISDGTIKRNKPIDIVCQPGLQECRNQADSIAKILYFDKENNVRLIEKGYDPNIPQSQYFHDFNILEVDDATLESDGGEVPTSILVTGETAFIDDCGLKNVSTDYILEDDFAPLSALYSQDTGGGINPYGAPLPVIRRTRKIVRKILTYDCETVICEKLITWEWKNLRTWRYRVDGDLSGTIVGWNFGYFMDQSAPNISSELYYWPEEKFIQTSEVTTYTDFSADQGLAFDGGWLYPPVASNYRNRVLYSGYQLLKSAIKTNISDPTLPWEQTNFITNKKVTGGGDGVSDTHTIEEYFGEKSGHTEAAGTGQGYLQFDLMVNDIRDDGYITRDRKFQYKTRIVPGGSYFYNGPFYSKYVDEKPLSAVLAYGIDGLILAEENFESKEINIYSADEQTGLQTIKTTVDYSTTPPRSKDETQDSDGFLPFATFKNGEGKNLKVQSFEFTIAAPVLLDSHPEYEKELQNSLVESEENAQLLAISELRESSALPASFSIPFNIPIDCGKKVRLHLRRTGINEHVFVRNVSGSWNGIGSTIVTKVSGRIYTI